METNVGIWRITLIDDGTLDTVLTATMRTNEQISYESRFGGAYAAYFRDDDGCLNEEGFLELAKDAAYYAYEDHEYRKADDDYADNNA